MSTSVYIKRDKRMIKLSDAEMAEAYWTIQKGTIMITDDKRLALAVKTVVEHDFKAASDRFYETHGRDSWAELEQAMWALQALGSPELIQEMEQVGIGHWTSTLAARHKTKAQA